MMYVGIIENKSSHKRSLKLFFTKVTWIGSTHRMDELKWRYFNRW